LSFDGVSDAEIPNREAAGEAIAIGHCDKLISFWANGFFVFACLFFNFTNKAVNDFSPLFLRNEFIGTGCQ